MKSGISLKDLAVEIERRAAAKKDYVVGVDNLAMLEPKPENKTMGLTLQLADRDAVGINTLAHRQIGEYLQIPAKYYDRMKDEQPALLVDNVNTWFKADPKARRMIRTLDGNARAFLSDRYRPLENEELAEAILPVLLDLDVEVMSSEITEQRLYIKAVHKSIRKDMPVVAKNARWGDGSHHIFRTQSPGIVISNSETGCGALSVETSIFDHVCTNLAVFGQHSMRQHHVGARHQIADQMAHLLTDETRRVSDKALWLQVRDVVRGAFDELQFGKRVDQIAELGECRIEGDPVEVINLTSRRLKLTEDEGKSVLRHFIEGGNLSALGIYNAVTRTAQDADDYDRASEMERMGGRLVELPRSEWREIAKAA